MCHYNHLLFASMSDDTVWTGVAWGNTAEAAVEGVPVPVMKNIEY